ncbi:X-ray radiation resistance-associated protein 1-like [Strongylocentrotus purpuratus]|uniref:X-ray radiation resistance-associated protein 1 n=1 Tax=Strongylocentrotus purpuratus TaxID=7668 RepID=A0A7M7NLE7_STRPU|nr:X-ray radiation resistance-associated protein 1-like [Strongylocentrotus purpuratus]
MAVPAGIKLEEGSSHFVSNSFPVRQIFGSSDSAGAWLVAHRTEQIRHLTHQPTAEPKTYAQLKYERKQKEKEERRANRDGIKQDEEEESTTPGVLDGFFLLTHCCVEDPTDLCSINISGQDLTEVKQEDFELFINVAYVNAGENLLPFDAFNHFPIIRELELPLNGLRGIHLDYNHFPYLEVLDLSHNNLSKDDVGNLGLLTSLKVLYLTGNQLRSLPPEMGKPFKIQISESESSRMPRFSKLEILNLDDNALHDLAIFTSLAGLRKLRQLNLDKNEIVSVPYLKALSGRLVAVDSTSDSTLRKGRPRSGKGKKKSGGSKELDQEERSEGTTPKGSPRGTPQDSELEKGAASEMSNLLDDIEEEGDLFDASHVLDGEMNKLLPPFPELTSLSLAYNKISEEEGLLGVAGWPMLQELIIHNNPLTTRNSGDPPLLKRYLTSRLGIRMVRKKPSMVPKPPVVVPNKPHRKVAEIVPPIPKKPLQLMLEGPTLDSRPALPSTSQTPPPKQSKHPSREESTRPSSQPLPPIQNNQDGTDPLPDREDQEERMERTKTWTEESFGESDVEDESRPEPKAKPKDKTADEPVFLTQVDEHPEDETPKQEKHAPKPPSQAPRPPGKPKTRKHRVDSAVYSINVPQKFKGYEMFYDAPDDPEVYTAPDIQSNLRSLRLALKHSTVYGENKVDLQRLQKPFKPYQKSKVAEKPAHPTKAEKLSDILEVMKSRETYVEQNLGEILADRDKMKDFPQVTRLLQEIQNKYSAVRNASMKDKQEEDEQIDLMIQDLEQLETTMKSAQSSRQPSREVVAE